VPPDERHPGDELAVLRAGEPELGPGGLLVEDLDPPVGLDVGEDRDRRQRHPRVVDDAVPVRRVERDDGALRPVGLEERQLRLEVLLHVGVVVEVVVAEVRERRDVEDQAVDAVAAQRLRADLDGHRTHLALAHAGQQGVHLARLGRGQAADDGEVADVALGRAAEAGHEPELAEDALEQVGGAGLAVRAGDGEQEGRVVAAGAVDPRRDVAEGRTGRVDEHHGQSALAGDLEARGVGQQRDGAALTCLRGELGTVPVLAGDAHVQVAGVEVRRAQRDSGDLDAVEGTLVLETELADQLGE
jgi:hypothetical protein